MAETRKLAAIMAVDVVGYSRLMGANEAGTAQTLREHRFEDGVIDRRGFSAAGSSKTMGDGVLLKFPSVVAAVGCAVAIQNMMVERATSIRLEARRIVYRIGVHLGDAC